MPSDKNIKHLEFIQSIISRMASNSFMLKGWAVTLVAGIFALSSKEADKVFFLVSYIPIIVFWGLDSYYLQQERLYRCLYDTVRKSKTETDEFSLAATFKKYPEDRNRWVSCLFSKTELWFYLPLALLCGIIIIISGLI